jgi:uncharacterized protein (DUF2236 family)
VPAPLWSALMAPLNTFASFLGAGGLDPALRDKLQIVWTAAQERRYQRFCSIIRAAGVVWELAPLKWRYDPAAVEGFHRLGVDPRQIRPNSATASCAVAASNHSS